MAVILGQPELEECRSAESARAMIEQAKSAAYQEAGLGVFTGVLLTSFDVEKGQMRFEVIPLSDFYHSVEP